MAKINFPGSPTNGQTYNQNGIYYAYDANVGAWVTSVIPRPLDVGTTINQQIIFNDASVSNGSNGMIFNKTANTAYFNNVAVTQNVSATYFKGNGSFLTGVASDLSPAYNTANAAYNTANAAFANANATHTFAIAAFTAANNAGVSVTNETVSSETYYPIFTTTTTGAAKANVDNTSLTFIPSTGTLSATIFNSLSDQSLKKDVTEFDGLNLLTRIHPVSFYWKDSNIKSYGVIAQEIEKELPELVQTTDNGIKSVSYTPMIAMLIDVVKKQEKRIAKLEKLLNKENK